MAERVARLETALQYERQHCDRQHSWLKTRIELLEAHRHTMIQFPAPNTGAWLKVIIALLLPISVLLATGSVEKALHAASVTRALP